MKNLATILAVLIVLALVADNCSAQGMNSASQTVTFSVQRVARVPALSYVNPAQTNSLKVTVGSDQRSDDTTILSSNATPRMLLSDATSQIEEQITPLNPRITKQSLFASQSSFALTPPAGKPVVTVTE